MEISSDYEHDTNPLSNLVTSKNLPTMHIDMTEVEDRAGCTCIIDLKGSRCGLVLEQSRFWGV